MDLYIQVGVILLFLAALSLFIYVYTTPAQKFTAKISENNQTIDDRLLTAEGMDVAIFKNNISAKGSSIYPMIRDAKANKLAIFVQTKNSQGLIVNYGYQLRPANSNTVKMAAQGLAGVGAGEAATKGTSFEQSFVTTADAFFNGTGTTTPVKAGAVDAKIDKTKIITNAKNDPASQGAFPTAFFYDPNSSQADAEKNGRTFGSTGLIYTNQVIKNDMPVNENFSYADNAGSVYRFDQNAAYYSTLIVNANNEVVGVYVEEHGVAMKNAGLAAMMYQNGTITELY